MTIDKIYTKLLNTLDMPENKRDELYARGLDDGMIDQFGYKFLSSTKAYTIKKLIEEFSDLSGCAGFYRSRIGEWAMSRQQGLAIPCLDFNGKIFCIKIRAVGHRAQKYTFLSTNPEADKEGQVKYPEGTKAKIGIHYPIGERTETVRITEGEIKADIATALSGVYTISLPGVSSWRMAIDAVKLLNPKKVLVSFDSDKDDKHSTSTGGSETDYTVRKAAANLLNACKEAGFESYLEHWGSSHGKGIDDVLIAGKEDEVRLLDNKEAEDFCDTALMGDLPRGWVYVVKRGEFMKYDKPDEAYTKEQFNDLYAPTNKKMNTVLKCLTSPDFPKACQITYNPSEKRLIEGGDIYPLFNIWRSGGVVPRAGDASILTNHVAMMLPDESEQKILLDYLAHIVQRPGVKINWMIVLQSIPGVGKSYLANMMSNCIGRHNIALLTHKMIHSEFNAWQLGCQLVVIHELMSVGKLDTMEILKDKITESEAVVREMYKPPIKMPNKYNFLAFTNHKNALLLDQNERRYCIMFSRAKNPSQEYKNMLWGWTDENADIILHHLLNRDISDFPTKGDAPLTTARKELVSTSLKPITAWIADCLKYNKPPFNKDVVSINDVLDNHIPNTLMRGRRVSLPCMGQYFIDAGFKWQRSIELFTGEYADVYSIRNHARCEKMTDRDYILLLNPAI